MKPFIRLLRFLAIACATATILALGYALYFDSSLRPVQPTSRPTQTQPLPPAHTPRAVDIRPTPLQSDASPLPLAEGYEQLVIDTIKLYAGVVDARVVQDGDTIHLVLVIPRGSSAEEARRMGENLVRLAKQYAEPENRPARLIGAGHYNYVLEVYGGTRKLDGGSKDAGEDHIRWGINHH